MTSGRRAISIAAAVAAAAVALLAWLWWRDLGDRSQIPSALVDRLAQSAAMIEREIDAELKRWEEMAMGPEDIGGLPDSGTLVVFGKRGVIRVRGVRLAYYPLVLTPDPPVDERLVRAQEAELKKKDLDQAIAAYRDAASSTARTVRAIATAGLARCLRAQGKLDEALETYGDLEALPEAYVEGFPAPMLAYRERQSIFKQKGDFVRTVEEDERLSSALVARNLMVDKIAFEALAPVLKVGRFPLEPFHRADATSSMWPRMREMPSGRAMGRAYEDGYAAVWRPVETDSRAIIAPVDALMKLTQTTATQLSVVVALEDSTSARLWGPRTIPSDAATHSLDRIGLPVTLRIWLKEP